MAFTSAIRLSQSSSIIFDFLARCDQNRMATIMVHMRGSAMLAPTTDTGEGVPMAMLRLRVIEPAVNNL